MEYHTVRGTSLAPQTSVGYMATDAKINLCKELFSRIFSGSFLWLEGNTGMV